MDLYSATSLKRVITLADGENLSSQLYRLEKGQILQFRLGPSLFGKNIKLFCNLPVKDAEFLRDGYRLLQWMSDCTNTSDDTALFIDLETNLSGSFHFYFTYGSEKPSLETAKGSGYFLVDPVLKVGPNDEVLPLNCIQCQTVLSKCLGPLPSWKGKLRVAMESGYNVIHFTPVQRLGGSRSAYSIRNQLQTNPSFNVGDKKHTVEDVGKLIDEMKLEWNVLSICDIVLNHTANEADWLLDHPEAGYNLDNAPYLRPAYLLDRVLHHLAVDIGAGKYKDKGLEGEACTEEHLSVVRSILLDDLLPAVRIEELSMVNPEELTRQFCELARNRGAFPYSSQLDHLAIIQNPDFKRFSSTVDIEAALRIHNIQRPNCQTEEERIAESGQWLKENLISLNEAKKSEIWSHLHAAVSNVLAGMRYQRLQHDGPLIKEVSATHPLVPQYFYQAFPEASLEEEEEMMKEKGEHILAHNGWVIGDDPLRNFAKPGTLVYLRRELIAWGDSVKLRYGEKAEDSPFLWEHMRKYVEEVAKNFHGIRLDNCHSTPIHVAEYLIDCARRVRPDLFVIAELFTNSDAIDNVFVNRLGITSLIREAMAAHDSHEQGRLIYRFGGDPVGAFFQPPIRPLVPSIAHAIFMDVTHDNPSPAEKRTMYDMIASSALVAMAFCATGSNRGYDELVPHHIHVVNEERTYASWSEEVAPAPGLVSLDCGIIRVKKALNDLHFYLGRNGYNQVFVDQMNPDVVAVTRHNPNTHKSVILVSHTVFNHLSNGPKFLRPLKLQGHVDEVLFECRIKHKKDEDNSRHVGKPLEFVKDPTIINGTDEYEVNFRKNVQVFESEIFNRVVTGDDTEELDWKDFPPGSIVAVTVSLHPGSLAAISQARQIIQTLPTKYVIKQESTVSSKKSEEFYDIVSKLSLADMNIALFRCKEEETDSGRPGTYDIPGFGPLVYCGLQGLLSLLSEIRPKNDLGHPLCGNLRDGNWMLGYVTDRLKANEGTFALGDWLSRNLQPLYNIPRYLIPAYFDAIITGVYLALLKQTWNLMNRFVKEGSTFVKALALASIQFCGMVRTAPLPFLSPNLKDPKPEIKAVGGQKYQDCITISAGLPHFSTGYVRNWGRDTFISLRGLLLLNGRFNEARYIILGFAACLRHGLIPNLLDGGLKARYNCRDAVWWWLKCIKEYIEEAPEGKDILDDLVSRLYPTDDASPLPQGVRDQPLKEVMQEAVQRHFQGISFRERGAGYAIDSHMTNEGFNVRVGVDWQTGFVYGGNLHNCGTWMDKMGSSEKAGTRGKPASPRDGSAIELVGLSRCIVGWLASCFDSGIYPYEGVSRADSEGNMVTWTYRDWANKIDSNFEKLFFIDIEPNPYERRPDLIHRRGMYKDTLGSEHPWADYQFRPNIAVAMVVAPEMFNPHNAWVCLGNMEQILLGQLGMKTLDPSDWAYRGDYDNANDSADPTVAHGFNYHMGPEWLWPIGFFLRAKLHFAELIGGEEELQRSIGRVKEILSKHFVTVQTSYWRSLPELTNRDGRPCHHSCPAQAWSISCVLEVLQKLEELEARQPV
ncbi:glycogen debranching enzyme-like [Artemia franciscana]|uniref:glycogen debranching enzyme-like n=1 Tax=Artemia franciscana TaxID=6661 RepID=UPI0032D9F7E7